VTEPPGEGASGRGNAVLIYSGVGVGVAGLAATGLGLYYGTQAQKISDEITDHAIGDPWVDIQEQQRRGQRNENLQIGFLVVGGVLVTAGVVMFAFGRASGEPDADQTVVRVVPTTNGVVVHGQF
jgi:hypothetical protein